MGLIGSFAELRSALWRQAWVILAVLAIGLPAVYAYAKSRPKVYEATGIVGVEETLGAVATQAAAITGMRASERIDQIQRFLLSRENILKILDNFELFPEAESETIRLGLTWGALSIERLFDPSLIGRPDAQPYGLAISVRLADPSRAAELANALVNSAIDEDYRRVRARLDAENQHRNRTLAHLLAEESRVSAETNSLSMDVADFRAIHADSLPENLPELRAQLEELRAQQVTINADLARSETTQGVSSLEASERYRAYLESQGKTVDEEIARVEALLAAAPEVESALTALTRRLETLDAELQVIVMQRTEASVNQALFSGQEFARLFVLETALPPEFPTSGSARKLALAGGVVILGVALGLAFLRELQRPAIRTASQMKRHLGIVPVVVIPYVAAPAALYRRMGLAGGILGAVALLIWYASAQESLLAPGTMSKLMQSGLPTWLTGDAAQ